MNSQQFWKARIVRTQRCFTSSKQNEPRPHTPAKLESNDQRVERKLAQSGTALHVKQDRLRIEIFVLGLAWQPSLTPSAESSDDFGKLATGTRKCIFQTVFALDPLNGACGQQGLQPIRQHRAGDPRNAPMNVAEAPAPAEQLADNEQCPASAQQLVCARHSAELSIASHDKSYRLGSGGLVRIPYQTDKRARLKA